MTSLWQQDGAPAHRARETVELMKEVTPDLIPPSLWPPNSPDLNPVDYAIWGIMQGGSTTRGRLQMSKNFASASWTSGNVLISALLTAQWRSGEIKRLRACAAAEGGQFEHELLLVKHCCCNCALWLCRLIVWLLITFAVTVFSVLWLFQSHAAVVKRYNAFCVNLTANSDTEQNNISKSTFSVCVSEHFHI